METKNSRKWMEVNLALGHEVSAAGAPDGGNFSLGLVLILLIKQRLVLHR